MPALSLGDAALPLHEAGKYVAAAYVVFILLLVIYVGIMAAKLNRISRDLEELAALAEGKRTPPRAESREETGVHA
jgi:hypothetical protein